MSKTSYTCTGCIPIDKSIVDTYVALLSADKSVEEAEEARVEAEAGRVEAETARVSAEASRVIAEDAREATSSADHAVAVSDHTTAVADHATAEGDHTTATTDHTASVEATEAAGVATARANAAAAAAEHMVDIKTGPQGPQGNTGSSVDYPYELVNNVTTDDATKGLSAAQGVVLDGKISQLGQEIGTQIEEISEQIYEIDEEITPIQLVNYFGGVMRKTNLLLEASASEVLKVYYVPVLRGKTYRVTGNNITLTSPNFSLIGFSGTIPATGVSYIDILSYDDNTGAKYYTIDYIAPNNGYLLLGYQDASEVSTRLSCAEITYNKTPKIGDLSNLTTLNKDNLVNAINDVNAKTITSKGVFIPIKLENYIRGIIRVSSLKIEASTDQRLHVYYFPVAKGNKYVINRRNCTHISSDWAIVGFTTEIPASGGGFSLVYSTAETGALTETITYTAPENGYLLLDYEDATEVYKRVSVIEDDFSVKNAVDALIAGESSKAQDAKTVLITPTDSFNIGLTRLKSKTGFLTPLVITGDGSNYNECIAEYQNIQDGRKTSQLIKVANYDLDPHIGDFSVLGQTYFRMLIGIDSEGWCYCAQRKYANLSSSDPNVNIYRTKDFSTFEIFKANSCGVQVTELENGELCVITIEEDDNYLKCFTYVTSGNKTIFNKKFSFTQISQYVPAYPWSWGVSTRGRVVVIGEYGQHGQCGVVWYSRNYGQNFYKIFDLREKAPDVPHAHVHGVCYDPYFDRVYIINGDGKPSTTPELEGKNPRIWWWDYNGELLSDDLKNTISWKYISVGEDESLGAGMQFVNGYALKDCVLLFSDGANNGIFRINRTTKEDTPTIDFAHHLGIEQQYTKFCGGNMFKKDENAPLFICGIREFSKDTEQSGQSAPNTYRTVISRIFTTYDGYHFNEVWLDNTYGEYLVHFVDGTSETHNIAKCGRDMCVYQLPNGHILMKYIGREFQYVYRNDVSTSGYVPFCNEVVEFVMK